jgi:phosphoribosylaminoimidazolecarboxamide formyltransferase/IMP cyclohydrolase
VTVPNAHSANRLDSAIRRALVSVSDKRGLIEFATVLRDLGIEVVSTGGTAATLRDGGVPAVEVTTVTGFPEILGGRVKSLHPAIHAGILAKRGDPEHERQLREHGLRTIDLVVVNLYPFEATVSRKDVSRQEAIEQIDIGGPTLIRAAAKNFEDVAVVVDPGDYAEVADDLRRQQGRLSRSRRLELAKKAFEHVARYDAAIATYLGRQSDASRGDTLPNLLDLRMFKVQDLRYGENPHQTAALYRDAEAEGCSLASAKQLQGKELSYNNLLDLDSALALAREFEEPIAAIVKHTNPSGVAAGLTLASAYRRAREADPASAYGGVVGFNRRVDVETARELSAGFVEAVAAPGFDEPALVLLRDRKALRLVVIEPWSAPSASEPVALELRAIAGGVLAQERDFIDLRPDAIRVVTRRAPTTAEMRALRFGWRVVKHVKSNAIVLADEGGTVGIGAGQMSRVDACRLAVMKAGSAARGAALASDAFFPFRDGIDVAVGAGVTAIIQPGGSIRDPEVIDAADEGRIAMVFTGIRHFRH